MALAKEWAVNDERGGELRQVAVTTDTAPHTVLGSTPVLLALPQQEPGSWDPTSNPLLLSLKPFLVAFPKQKTGPEPPNLGPNPTHLP